MLAERYEFEREIGRGGAAYVFLAQDRRTAEHVAVKVLRPGVAATLGEGRFQREIDIARSLEHPNILPVLDAGAGDGQLYFAMPFVDGETLRERLLREQQLKLADALAIARAVANALDHAHARGVIHRDIKPANILLDGARAVISDFGIARAMSLMTDGEVTESGVVIGTPEYMSPEQGTASRQLDARSDIYALGCVVYEMLAGEPPFTGPTAQAIIARHCHEPPYSLRVIRPAIPIGVEEAVGKALAKVPADRFSTAGEFVSALEEGAASGATARFRFAALSTRTRILLGAAVVALLGVGGWYVTRPPDVVLDPNRIVVFPLHNVAASATDATGDEVATFIGYALDGTRPLKWLDGWELLGGSTRASATRLGPNEARRLSRQVGAGFYIDGSIIRQPDSVTVLLSVFSVIGDSLVRRAQVAGAATVSLHQLGLRAIAELLPALVAPGGKIDLTALSQRRPIAVANFLQGEREYRRMQFKTALAHYEASLREDSAFALAALRGAQAANWLSDFGIDVRLAETALRNIQFLPPAQALLTRGLHAYVTGAADSAMWYLQRAVRSDSTLHAAWALLGEVASRMLHSEPGADSLARGALERARRNDNDFAPTLLLLEEMALRDGDVAAVLRLREELRRAGADTSHATSRDLMLQCVRDGTKSIDWQSAVARDQESVLLVGKTLSARAAQPECAVAAFGALLSADKIPPNARWGALLGIQAMLAATDQPRAAVSVFSLKGTAELPVHNAYLLVATAGGPFEQQANAFADAAAGSYGMRASVTLWHLAGWEARRGNIARVREIAMALRAKADSSASRRDKLLTRAVDARLRLLEGDSVGALALLRALAPTASRGELAWQPWESLGGERLLFAELLFARGQFAETRKVAEQLDATEPITYPLYMRAGLDLRSRSAAAMKDFRSAEQYRRRLTQLSGKRVELAPDSLSR